MIYIKNHRYVCAYIVVILVLWLLVFNHQVLYGGYEGLFYHSLLPFFGETPVDISGELYVDGSGQSEVSQLLDLTVDIEGEIFLEQGKAYLDFSTELGGEVMSLGRLALEGDCLAMMVEEAVVWQSKPIRLNQLRSKVSTGTCEGITPYVDQMNVERQMLYDLKPFAGSINKEMTCYYFDVMDALMVENVKKSLEKFEAFDPEEAKAQLIFGVDGHGDLAVIKLNIDYDELGVDGWLMFSS